MKTLFLAALLTACSGGETPPGGDATADHKDDHAKTDAHDHDGKGEHDHEKAGSDHNHDDIGKGGQMNAKKPPEGAKVMFVEPADGAKVKSPVKVVMGVEGMEVKPAGELTEGTGHHHIIVDSDPVPFGVAVPADETHIHFGKGQTETELELKAGEHKLQLQFADGVHRSYGEQMTATITVTVE